LGVVTVTVTGQGGTPAGDVGFSVEGAPLGTSPLSGGAATFYHERVVRGRTHDRRHLQRRRHLRRQYGFTRAILYTAIVSGSGGTTGVGLVDVFIIR